MTTDECGAWRAEAEQAANLMALAARGWTATLGHGDSGLRVADTVILTRGDRAETADSPEGLDRLVWRLTEEED